jgi:hypothetical protein
MSDIQETVSILRQRLNDNWSATGIDWSDFNAKPYKPAPTAAWIRPTLRGGDTFRASLGPNARRRTIYTWAVQVFVPEGQGDATLRSYMEQVGDLFRDYQTSGVTCLTPSFRVVGRDPEGLGYQGNVTVPVRVDRIV